MKAYERVFYYLTDDDASASKDIEKKIESSSRDEAQS
jgi:hypothetical protein